VIDVDYSPVTLKEIIKREKKEKKSRKDNKHEHNADKIHEDENEDHAFPM